MDLSRRLTQALLETHPQEAAAVLETLAGEDAASLLASAPATTTAAVLARTAPTSAAALLERLGAGEAGAIVAALPLDCAAGLLRRMDPERRGQLAALPPEQERSLALLLRFPEGSAGSLMDPRVLALPQDVSVEEAIRRLRASPQNALYNLYVIDREQRLVGVLNLRELLLARPAQRLAEVMHTRVQRVGADLDRHSIVTHPGWREVHSLPVVDAVGVFLGAIRYRTLRRLEDEIDDAERGTGLPTAQALGDLFWTGFAGLLEAMTGAAAGVGAPAPAPRG